MRTWLLIGVGFIGLLLAVRSAGAAARSPEAQKAFDVGLSLYNDALLDATPANWDAAIEALAKAQEDAPMSADAAALLASACTERGLPLAAIAWGRAYLYAAPLGEKAENVRAVIEHCSRQVEATRIKIFAAAKTLADQVPAAKVGQEENGLWTLDNYTWQRMQFSPYMSESPVRLDYADRRTHVKMDVLYVQARSGDFTPFLDEAKAGLADSVRNPSLKISQAMTPRFGSAYWMAFFTTCLETEDWQGAFSAVDWSYSSLAAPDEVHAQVVAWAWPHDHFIPAEGKTPKQMLLEKFYARQGLHTSEDIVKAWEQLAVEVGQQERDYRIEEQLQQLQQAAGEQQGEPEKLPVQVADLAAPMGKALRRMQALETASDDALLTELLPGMLYAAYKAGSGKLSDITAFLADNPHLPQAQGYRGLTALHLAAFGDLIPLPVEGSWFDEKLTAFDGYYSPWKSGLFNFPRSESITHTPQTAHAIVKLFLDNHAEVNARMSNGWTPLHMAAEGVSGEADALEIVKTLLDGGARVDARANNGITPIHIAAGNGLVNVVNYLLAKGSDINVRADDGSTPLHFAVDGGSNAEVAALLAKGARVDEATSSLKETPLLMAARLGRSEVAKLLIAAGADLTATDLNGLSASRLAAANGNTELADYLEAREDAAQ